MPKKLEVMILEVAEPKNMALVPVVVPAEKTESVKLMEEATSVCKHMLTYVTLKLSDVDLLQIQKYFECLV